MKLNFISAFTTLVICLTIGSCKEKGITLSFVERRYSKKTNDYSLVFHLENNSSDTLSIKVETRKYLGLNVVPCYSFSAVIDEDRVNCKRDDELCEHWTRAIDKLIYPDESFTFTCFHGYTITWYIKDTCYTGVDFLFPFRRKGSEENEFISTRAIF